MKNSFAVISISFAFLLIVAAPALAIDNLLPVQMGKGIRISHEYTFYVTTQSGSHLAGPYTMSGNRNIKFGIRSDTQARRNTKICVVPEGRARPLVGGRLVLNDKRVYKLVADDQGIVCTPQGVNVDDADISHMIVNAR